MKYAIAMYRAGFQVAADDCNHESAKKLGLICPFCKEAVFLRQGSAYPRSGKNVLVSASFAHYHSDEPTAKQCELRAVRKEGKDYLAYLDAESKNQRLKLFNDHLWAMLANQIKISRQELTYVQKYFGRKNLGRFSREMAKCWREREVDGLNYAVIVKTIEDLKKRRTEAALTVDTSSQEIVPVSSEGICELPKPADFAEGLGPQTVFVQSEKVSDPKILTDFLKSPAIPQAKEAIERERIRTHLAWISGVDEKLHLSICHEICSFLGTRTAGYAWEKICTTSLRDLHGKLPDMKPAYLAHTELFRDGMMWWIAVYIAYSHWLEEINKRGDWQEYGPDSCQIRP